MTQSDETRAAAASDQGPMPSVARIRSLLEQRLAESGSEQNVNAPPYELPAALRRICDEFHLSPFERDILVLCAGMELDPAISALCAAIHGDERRPWPSFQAAFDVLPEAHWTALLPQAPLRYWKLIEVGPGETLTLSPLRIAEAVLHFLMGVPTFDERLSSVLEQVSPPAILPGSYRVHAERLIELWTKEQPSRPVVHLQGNAVKGKRSLASAACSALGLHLQRLRAAAIPVSHTERELLARLWERDAVLDRSVLLLDAESAGPAEWESCSSLADRIDGLVLVAGPGPLDLCRRPVVSLGINLPGKDEQRALWQHTLGKQAERLNGELDRMVAQFALDPEDIQAATMRVREVANPEREELFPMLWEACRDGARSSLEGKAQRIYPRAGWQDIVLPDSGLEMLKAIVSHVRHQGKVLEQWGFASQSSRGHGITALFCGPSGTGKTLAAEVLANELKLDLYHIDLSQVVSKYIGETEKHLRIVFDAAERSGAVLLFDEADALFGKRSEVKDSHDRYANIEVSYLLQRMEAYRGLAILTTNLRSALDTAFLRRIRFIVNFPFPDPSLRRRIWERMFPAQTPTSTLDWEKLSHLNLPGGNIRNIAINAAFMAAADDGPVSMQHLLVCARRECNKLEKQLSEGEIGGWA